MLHADFSLEGDGRIGGPAILTCTLRDGRTVTISEMRSLLPKTVNVEPGPGETGSGDVHSFVLRAKNPAMSRAALSTIFYELMRQKRLTAKHQA